MTTLTQWNQTWTNACCPNTFLRHCMSHHRIKQCRVKQYRSESNILRLNIKRLYMCVSPKTILFDSALLNSMKAGACDLCMMYRCGEIFQQLLEMMQVICHRCKITKHSVHIWTHFEPNSVIISLLVSAVCTTVTW